MSHWIKLRESELSYTLLYLVKVQVNDREDFKLFKPARSGGVIPKGRTEMSNQVFN